MGRSVKKGPYVQEALIKAYEKGLPEAHVAL